MDSNDFLSILLSDESLKSISKAAGAEEKDVKNVLTTALPSLLTGALGQTQNEETVEGFAGALSDHAKVDTRDLGSFMSNADMMDGGKILTHLLGGNATAVAQETATRSGLDLGSTIKILALAAPLLMSLLGQHNQQAQTQTSTGLSPVVSLLGGLLGGGQQQQQQSSGLGLLSGLLGGGQQQSSGFGLLGGLLGGGQQQQQQSSGLDLLGGLLGGGQQQAPAATTSTTSGGKKKKKKKPTTSDSQVLSLETPAAETQQQSSGGLMDILLGLLK